MNRPRMESWKPGCLLIAVTAVAGCTDNSSRIKSLETEVAQLRRQQAATAQAPESPPAKVTWRPIRSGAMLTIDGSVLFYSGQARLRDSGKKILARVASDIQAQFSDKTILVMGHTDNDPITKTSWLDNRELSAARSVAIVRVLEAHGVLPRQLIASGCGEHRPLAANDSPKGKAQNRRVEIAAIEPLLGHR